MAVISASRLFFKFWGFLFFFIFLSLLELDVQMILIKEGQ